MKGDVRSVAKIVLTNTYEPVFNLYTEGEHTFIADGSVVHNFSYFRTLRTVFHQLFIDSNILRYMDQVATQ